MTVLTAGQQAAAVREAARAPSVHNVQPARWHFAPDGDVVLLRAPGRELPVGDPTGHDLAASLGAAWEGMSIALSRIGLSLGAPSPAGGERLNDWVPVVRAPIARGAADPLASSVPLRRSFRGRFATPGMDSRARLGGVAAGDAIVVLDAGAIADVAQLHDRATWHFESSAAYHAELWSWLRLSPADPRWSRDGLNADCLALSRVERGAAKVLMRPGVFALLSRLGVARHLVSEAPAVLSATGIVLFAPRRDLAPFDVGRRFYRLWLEITAAGLHAAPMSATSDYAGTRDALAARFLVPAGRRIANVLRVGEAASVAESPRLDVPELMLPSPR